MLLYEGSGKLVIRLDITIIIGLTTPPKIMIYTAIVIPRMSYTCYTLIAPMFLPAVASRQFSQVQLTVY